MKIEVDEIELDKIAKILVYFLNKHRDEIYQECCVTEEDNEQQTYIKCMSYLDKIYAEECKKYPEMWYCYGFGGKK